MSQRKPGRVRQRLAAMLSKELGQPIEPADLWDNNYPDAREVGAARWGFHMAGKGQGYISIHSWDRMGECVRNGFKIRHHADGAVEICANETPAPIRGKPLIEIL